MLFNVHNIILCLQEFTPLDFYLAIILMKKKKKLLVELSGFLELSTENHIQIACLRDNSMCGWLKEQ